MFACQINCPWGHGHSHFCSHSYMARVLVLQSELFSYPTDNTDNCFKQWKEETELKKGRARRAVKGRGKERRSSCDGKETASCPCPVWPQLLLNFEFRVMILEKRREVTGEVTTSNAPRVTLGSLTHMSAELSSSMSSCPFPSHDPTSPSSQGSAFVQSHPLFFLNLWKSIVMCWEKKLRKKHWA